MPLNPAICEFEPVSVTGVAKLKLLKLGIVRSARNGKTERARHVLLDYTLIRRQSDAAPRRRPSTRAQHKSSRD